MTAVDHSYKGEVTLQGADRDRLGARLVQEAVKRGLDAELRRRGGSVHVRVYGDGARAFSGEASKVEAAPTRDAHIEISEVTPMDGGTFRARTKLAGFGAAAAGTKLMNEATARGLQASMRKNLFTGRVTIRTSGEGARQFAHAVPSVLEKSRLRDD